MTETSSKRFLTKVGEGSANQPGQGLNRIGSKTRPTGIRRRMVTVKSTCESQIANGWQDALDCETNLHRRCGMIIAKISRMSDGKGLASICTIACIPKLLEIEVVRHSSIVWQSSYSHLGSSSSKRFLSHAPLILGITLKKVSAWSPSVSQSCTANCWSLVSVSNSGRFDTASAARH